LAALALGSRAANAPQYSQETSELFSWVLLCGFLEIRAGYPSSSNLHYQEIGRSDA
jgi:hypothetical protein